jgi:prepilin-type N-terminal cleavage/methylation domain-containing protein
MHSHSMHIRCKGPGIFSKLDPRLLEASGFSLVEVLVSIVILGALGAGVASILSGGNTALIRTRGTNQLEEAVDQDLARIKDIAFRMTCCSGSCTTETGRSSPCSIDPSTNTFYTPGRQNYYFPDSTLDSGGTAINAFTAKCNNGTLVTELVSLIGNANLPPGVTRQFDTTQAASHRLTVTYSGATASRSYTFVPTLAAWCP